MKKALPLLSWSLLLFAPLLGCIGQVDGTGALPSSGAGGTTTIEPGHGTGGHLVSGGAGGGGGAPVTAASGLPCDIQTMLVTRCVTCHGAVPSGGAPMSIVSYADLMAPAKSNPSMTVAQVSLARMQNATAPMPPAPAVRASTGEIAAMQSWSASGYQMGTCGTATPDGGTGAGGRTGSGGNRGQDAGADSGIGSNNGLPCDVQALLASRCVSCHGTVPSGGAPMSMVSYADLMAPARSNPSMTVAQVSLARMQNATSPMPPAPAARASTSEIATMQGWSATGYSMGSCGTAAPDGGGTPDAGGMGGRGGGTGGMTGKDGGTATGLPCDVQSVLAMRCTTCHGSTPSQGAPMSLVTYADLAGPSRSNPSMTVAQLSVARMQNSTSPMPPAPATRSASSEITTIQSWINANYPQGTCGGSGDGGAGDGGMVADPFKAPATCTSKKTWSGGNEGSSSMNPGRACIDCHSRGEGPGFSIAGTVYPTAHEPDLCNGFSGSGAQVVIIGADGKTTTLTPNGAGNFYSSTSIAKPFQAKVVYQGRERIMVAKQTTGDCNLCHTQSGSMSAPGRILLP